MQQYQIFWKDNDRPVDDYEVGFSGFVTGAGYIQLSCSDGRRILINLDEVRTIVIHQEPS